MPRERSATTFLRSLGPGVAVRGRHAAAAQTIETDPWRSLGIGVAVLLGAPAAALALLVTVIGIPLGLVLLAGYLVSLAALLFGMGALVLRLHRTYRGGAPTPVAAHREPPPASHSS